MPTRLFVSVGSGLIVQRESEGESIRYDAYQSVDGEMVPFRWTIRDSLGESTVTVSSVHFNVAIPESAFQSAK